MLLKVYIDDSAYQKKEKAVVAGAFVGNTKQWSGLKIQWQRRLRKVCWFSLKWRVDVFR